MRRKEREGGPVLPIMAGTIEKISAGKFGQGASNCYHSRRSGSHSGKSAKLRHEPKTTTKGGEKREAKPPSFGARRNPRPLGSDCRVVGHGAAASSSRSACCS